MKKIILKVVAIWVTGISWPVDTMADQVVKVSSFGYDPVDSTRFIQKTLDSGARKIVLDKQSGPWVTLPLLVRSNTEFLVEPHVELLAKRGEFKGIRDYLFTLDGVTNVTIRGGEGSTFRMWKSDYQKPPYAKSEWRYTLRIIRSENVHVEGMRFIESGGDGIVIAQSKNVTIRNCLCDRNHRQGISLCSGENVLIENTVMSNTSGTAPQAGIDLEPDTPGEKLVNCTLRNCLSENNQGDGFTVYLNSLNEDSSPVSILFENCRSVGNRNAAAVSGGGGREDRFVKGWIRFRGCTFDSPRFHGISVGASPATAFSVSFADCVISNVSPDNATMSDVCFNAPRIRQGFCDGVDLGNLTIFQPIDRPWFTGGKQAIGPSPTQITGTVRVVKPTGKTETTVLDRAWAEKNLPAIHGGKSLSPRRVFPESGQADVTVIDTARGKAVELSPVAILCKAKVIFFAEAPGRVLFTGRQVIAVPGRPAGQKPLTVTAIKQGGGKGRSWKIPNVRDQSTEFSFDAPARGFYRLQFPDEGTRFYLEKSTVPVAVDATSDEHVIAPIQRKTFSLWFDAPAGDTFSFLCRGDSYYRFSVKVFSPDGKLFADQRIVEDIFLIEREKNATGGLWRVDFDRAEKPNYDWIRVDMGGVPGCFFLSPEKRWQIGNGRD
ncbi:MAG: right-handed parallel beta-helix repeat-containing protein [Kiritimatiellae bacterium]|nr:right-handed parallel beta-helix repeat-containing protein [Kiritimatiellia bacterium]